MKRRKIFAAAAAVVIAALTLVGCAGPGVGASGGENAKRIAVFSAGYTTPPIKFTLDTFKSRAVEQGWTVDLYTTDGDFDTLNGYIQQQIHGGYDVFFMAGIDPVPLSTGISEARSAGIPIFAADADVKPNEVFTLNVATDQSNVADISVQALGEIAGKNVAVVTFEPSTAINTRSQLATEALKAAGANVVVTHKIPNITDAVNSTLSFVTDYLQAHPDGLDAVWTGLEPAAIGAVQAISESGKDVSLVSSDAMKATATMIADGGPFQASVKQDWPAMIDKVIDGMKTSFDGGTLETNYITVPGVLVAKENATSIELNY